MVWPRFANGGHESRLIENGLEADGDNFVDGNLGFQQAVMPKNPSCPLITTW
jgi:hypothetical protein